MSQIAPIERDTTTAQKTIRRGSWAWLGVVPFFAFALAFLLLPAASIAINS
jgi:putative spermidine/putrescine transport system permease protein